MAIVLRLPKVRLGEVVVEASEYGDEWGDPAVRVSMEPDEARLYGLAMIRAADKAEGDA